MGYAWWVARLGLWPLWLLAAFICIGPFVAQGLLQAIGAEFDEELHKREVRCVRRQQLCDEVAVQHGRSARRRNDGRTRSAIRNECGRHFCQVVRCQRRGE